MRLFLTNICFVLVIPLLAMGGEERLIPSGSVRLDRFDVHYYESSGTAGPGILLIHGNTSSANSYARIMHSKFAQEYRVVAVDLPGYGLSQFQREPFLFSEKSAFNIALWKSAIQKVAQATGVDRGVLVGWSWGGDLAILASTDLPDLQGLFIFGTAPMGETDDEAPEPFLSRRESYAGAAFYLGVLRFHNNLMTEHYVTSFFSEDYAPIPEMIYQDGIETDSKTRSAILKAGLGMDPDSGDEISLLRNLTIPLALVHAEQDAFVNESYLRFLEKDFPTLWQGKTIVVPDSGHIIQWEKPEEFTRLLQEFIEHVTR